MSAALGSKAPPLEKRAATCAREPRHALHLAFQFRLRVHLSQPGAALGARSPRGKSDAEPIWPQTTVIFASNQNSDRAHGVPGSNSGYARCKRIPRRSL